MRFPKAMFTDVTLVLVTATLLVIPALAQQNGLGSGGDGTDRIFLGVNSGSVNMYPVGTSSTDTFPTTVTTATENGGTSGIVVDNNSGAANASSLYFATLSGNTAVKLTQSGLQ